MKKDKGVGCGGGSCGSDNCKLNNCSGGNGNGNGGGGINGYCCRGYSGSASCYDQNAFCDIQNDGSFTQIPKTQQCQLLMLS
ncbi:Hypothetical predicted protein [Octopus vulgaris]|uniref:Uncharacterized protein n=1 Tax=Octopus vulgaris TaxID=6645 RepID=A0AA36AN74_OCTVU|nr:Hypothetical predicted protein [Octopus vulgaris]